MEEHGIKSFSIGIIGGTGKEGKGLAYRWAKAGYTIYLGSRVREKAEQVASDLNTLFQGKLAGTILGMENREAAQKADIVVLTVPYSAHRETLMELKEVISGKILIDVTVPLVPPKVTRVQMPPEGSAAQAAQMILGSNVQVVSAFQNISYEHLLRDEQIDCDVLICGGSKAAKQAVLELVRAAGLHGWDAGPIENSMVVEGLTSILIGINKQFGTQSAGIRITGVPRE
ncbi:reduced coenzyme F420:NADP oxidoreductase [Anaerolinea thermolimosa]|mgnify:CR=1 FL=1|uniref:NADPH-dependent F420 reductase n=1 Tax=Anaerolinea thermolimosa TaxID=229919 RepID=UPI0007844733|nr:NADPH-dependent F420 reductase [Anaerolinea thermolimosa]GAP06358.1 reduced coenzyme F420:NADP oxidoreductase [Anaerolinea thermolimosa]